MQLITRTIFMKRKKKTPGMHDGARAARKQAERCSWRPTRALIELPEINEAARPSLSCKTVHPHAASPWRWRDTERAPHQETHWKAGCQWKVSPQIVTSCAKETKQRNTARAISALWARQSSLETSGTHERTGGSRLQAPAQSSSVLRFCSRLSVLRVAGGGVVSFFVPSLFGRSPSSLKRCFFWSTRGPINTERKAFFFQDCCFRTLFSRRCESSAMTCSSCVPLFKEMHNSHVSRMAATKVFLTEILERLFAESGDGKVSADDLLNMDKTAMHRWPFAKFVAVMFFLSSSVRTLVGFQ